MASHIEMKPMSSNSGTASPLQQLSGDAGVAVRRLRQSVTDSTNASLSLIGKICGKSVGTFSFWVFKTTCIIFEPIISSYERTPVAVNAQIAVLAVSVFFFVVQLIGDAYSRADEIDEYFKIDMGYIDNSQNHLLAYAFSQRIFRAIKFYLSRAEYILEAVCLFIGWVFIFQNPGIAELRLFRIFCLLWYNDLPVFRQGTIRWTYRLLGDWGLVMLGRIYDVLQFATLSLISLGNEMFFVTDSTRGGFILMGMLFYSAYVFGLVLHVETLRDPTGPTEACQTIGTCMFTMLRLTFFDGTGFDFLYSLSYNHPFLFFLVMAYLCMTSFGIINGLLSIFANSFGNSSTVAFDEEDRKKSFEGMKKYAMEKEAMVLPVQIRTLKNKFVSILGTTIDEEDQDQNQNQRNDDKVKANNIPSHTIERDPESGNLEPIKMLSSDSISFHDDASCRSLNDDSMKDRALNNIGVMNKISSEKAMFGAGNASHSAHPDSSSGAGAVEYLGRRRRHAHDRHHDVSFHQHQQQQQQLQQQQHQQQHQQQQQQHQHQQQQHQQQQQQQQQSLVPTDLLHELLHEMAALRAQVEHLSLHLNASKVTIESAQPNAAAAGQLEEAGHIHDSDPDDFPIDIVHTTPAANFNDEGVFTSR